MEEANRIARSLGSDFDDLSFICGDISPPPSIRQNFPLPIGQESNNVDVLIALHACDTATDEAIWRGIASGSSLILTAPCCHKEVRAQLDSAFLKANVGKLEPANNSANFKTNSGTTTVELRDLLRHGIFRERHAEMLTDSLRALLLEASGYDVTVMEFVGAEHTSKNVMVAAVKRERDRGERVVEELAWERVEALMATSGLTRQRLYDRLSSISGKAQVERVDGPAAAPQPVNNGSKGRRKKSVLTMPRYEGPVEDEKGLYGS